MLGWFDTKPAKAFARQLADEVVTLVGNADESAKKRDKQLAKLHRLFGRINAFSERERLNIYKKAKLSQALGHALIEKGYPQDFAEQVVHLTLTQLTPV